jgi:hypothetical protein
VSGPILLTRAHRWRNGLPVFLTTAERDLNIPSPMQGEACYVDDNTAAEGLQTFSGTGWRPVAWNTSWGVVGTPVNVTADQNGITTVVDLTSLSVAFTAVNGRRYKTTLSGRVLQNTASATTNEMYITDGSNVQVQASTLSLGAAIFAQHMVVAIETITAGAVTRKGRLATNAGTVNLDVAANQPAFIVVEDIGPSGAPT